MAEASKLCPYEQGYLSLLARRKELRAEKIGRNWYTKIEWLNCYIATKKPTELIVTKEGQKKQTRFGHVLIATLAMTVMVLGGFFFYGTVSKRIAEAEKKSVNAGFSQTQIMKIPNENGSMDVYSVGQIKVGTEKISE